MSGRFLAIFPLWPSERSLIIFGAAYLISVQKKQRAQFQIGFFFHFFEIPFSLYLTISLYLSFFSLMYLTDCIHTITHHGGHWGKWLFFP
ncbi:hypothetical protein BDP67DRAFT_199152 [Colletotrichum lupini]|nr:hypothetical protein BDP67DRAFT_199152 [Colletotrichum lupini]